MYNEEAHHDHIFRHSDTPSFEGTLLIYFISGILLIFLGARFQSLHLLGGLVVSEFAFIVAPAFLYTLWNRYSISRTFRIVPISFKTVIITIIIATAAFVLVGIVAAFQEMIFPHSEDYQEIWQAVLEEFHQIPLIITLFLVSILPGTCEELLFRGFLLHGMRKKCSDGTAIIIVGFLFGAFHLDPYRFLPVSLLGILFGYMVIKTGSLFTGIVAHSTNNAIAILLSYAGYVAQDSGISKIQPQELSLLEIIISIILMIGITTIALVVFLAGLRALPKAQVVEEPVEEPETPHLYSLNELEREDDETHP